MRSKEEGVACEVVLRAKIHVSPETCSRISSCSLDSYEKFKNDTFDYKIMIITVRLVKIEGVVLSIKVLTLLHNAYQSEEYRLHTYELCR